MTVIVPATLGASVAAGTSIANTASRRRLTRSTPTLNKQLVTDTFVGRGSVVDLGVGARGAPDHRCAGDTVTYTVTVTNPDTATDATNVVVTDALPWGSRPSRRRRLPTAVRHCRGRGQHLDVDHPDAGQGHGAGDADDRDRVVRRGRRPATTLTTITNTVNMTGDADRPTPANNTASVDLTISAEIADLNIVTGGRRLEAEQGRHDPHLPSRSRTRVLPMRPTSW